MPPKLVPVICRKLGPNNFECPLPKNHPGKHDFGEEDEKEAEKRRTKVKVKPETVEREQEVIKRYKTAAVKARQQMERQLFCLQTVINMVEDNESPESVVDYLATNHLESDLVGALRQLEGRLSRELQESDRYNDKQAASQTQDKNGS